jgi:(R)-amidase
MVTDDGTDLRIALVQMSLVDGDVARNLDVAASGVAEAARAGADVVVLPEMTLTGFPYDRLEALAEPLDGPGAAAFARMAGDHQVVVVAGLPRRDESGGGVFNTTIAVDPGGELLAAYDKTHLYDREKTAFTPGASLDGLFSCRGVCFGLLCCFDIELPETARTLALLGARCLLVPSANMEPWGLHHRVFARSRALENHLFVAYCNGVGPCAGATLVGESCIVDPFGRIVCDAGPDERTVWGDLDLRVADESRRVYDYLRERRPELYR